MSSGPFHRPEDSFSTVAVHAGYDPDEWPHKPVVEPLVTSSTFKMDQPGVFEEFNYSRCGNPCRKSLELRLAAMEGAKYAATFPSGVSVVFAIGSMFQPGDHFIVSNDLYGGTMKCFVQLEKKGTQIDYVDLVSDLKQLQAKLRPDTKLLWLESPTNPTLSVIDIQAVCAMAKSVAKDIVIVVDNTFLTAYFQRPLQLGATVSMYSLTKYVNGHADVVMGAAVTNCPKMREQLEVMQEVNGLCPSPFDCYQVSRGVKTLALRMEQHSKNSLKIARFLAQHPCVTKVNHPGLESHPQHELTTRQATGHSGIMSFAIHGGIAEVTKFVSHLKVIILAASLGGVETLVASPALMSHDMVSQEKRDKMGITDSLIRMSVGIESADDLIQDIDQALNEVYGEIFQKRIKAARQ